MSNVSQWSTTAANNNSASPDGHPEGMAPSGVNDSNRENMAALAKWYKDQQGTLVTGGTTTAYTLTTNNAHAALGDIGLFAFRVNAANTGSATLNVDSLGAKTMKVSGVNLASGDLSTNEIAVALYNSTNDVFDLFRSAAPPGLVLLQTVTASNDATIDVGEGGEIDSTYSEYVLELINVVPATDSVTLRMQTSANGGTGYDSGANNYLFSQVQNVTLSTGDEDYILVTGTVGSDTNEHGVCGTVRLYNPSAAAYTSVSGTGMYTTTTPGASIFHFAGIRKSAAAVDAVRFLFASGNVESGTVKLYGVK